jgi:excinuclease ABC subunit C
VPPVPRPQGRAGPAFAVMPITALRDLIARLPEQPGVYLYANEAGETIYVGKARVLRDRVRSYLGARGNDPKTDALLDEVHALTVVVTDSVPEALALESNLIKQRSPKYNILLRDDKSYPYLQLTTGEAFPRLLVARRVEEEDGHAYYGPFLPARLARRTIDLTHRLFGLRSCNEVITGERPRPCLEYDIKRCVAPCVAALCSQDDYAAAVAGARLLLDGRRDALVADLDRRMQAAAEGERYEEAAHWRDAVRTVEAIRDRQQKMATAGLGDRDGFGVRLGARGAAVVVFQMRGGRVVDRVELWSEGAPVGSGAPGGGDAHAREAEVVAAALSQFYAVHVPPPEVHVPVPLEDAAAVEEWLTAQAGRRVRLVVPRRGDKRSLLDLATRNARVAYEARGRETAAGTVDALEALRLVIQLPATPRRIECFDISTFQGSETVASMVVCAEGRMQPREYRKFRIRPDEAPLPAGVAAHAQADARVLDDFRSMRQVVRRRYKAVVERGGPIPDLIVIDGGKGQLAAAYAALVEVGLDGAVAIGLAKQEELVFTRDAVDAIAFPAGSPALRLLQRIRDEAHRFAVTYHRAARTRRDLQSALDAIEGVGPRRRNTLLRRFGSVAGVRRATREELTAVVGAKLADAILAHFAL